MFLFFLFDRSRGVAGDTDDSCRNRVSENAIDRRSGRTISCEIQALYAGKYKIPLHTRRYLPTL